jgi:uncharacterized protein YoxC
LTRFESDKKNIYVMITTEHNMPADPRRIRAKSIIQKIRKQQSYREHPFSNLAQKTDDMEADIEDYRQTQEGGGSSSSGSRFRSRSKRSDRTVILKNNENEPQSIPDVQKNFAKKSNLNTFLDGHKHNRLGAIVRLRTTKTIRQEVVRLDNLRQKAFEILLEINKQCHGHSTSDEAARATSYLQRQGKIWKNLAYISEDFDKEWSDETREKGEETVAVLNEVHSDLISMKKEPCAYDYTGTPIQQDIKYIMNKVNEILRQANECKEQSKKQQVKNIQKTVTDVQNDLAQMNDKNNERGDKIFYLYRAYEKLDVLNEQVNTCFGRTDVEIESESEDEGDEEEKVEEPSRGISRYFGGK